METIREVLFLLSGVASTFRHSPMWALVPSGIFLALYVSSAAKKRLVLLAAFVWFAYVPWEYGMQYRILCSGECNIRIDLLLYYPMAILISLAALVVLVRDLGKQKRKP